MARMKVCIRRWPPIAEVVGRQADRFHLPPTESEASALGHMVALQPLSWAVLPPQSPCRDNPLRGFAARTRHCVTRLLQALHEAT